MVKIYISSTSYDLKEFREKSYRALRQLRHDVVAMEDYVASGHHPPLDKCLSDVATCDLYVGIFAWRYGFIPPESNPDQKSISELEYRKACEDNIPCLIFLLDPEAPWSPKFMDSSTGEGDQGKKIKIFRQELGQKKIVSFFKTPDELAGLVRASVSNWEQEAQLEEQAQSLEDMRVEKLILDSRSVEWINLGLEIGQKRLQAGQLSEEQIQKFDVLKSQVQQITSINKQLREAGEKAQSLIYETQQTLQAEIEKLRSAGSHKTKNLLELDSDKSEIDDRLMIYEKQYELLKQFEKSRENGQKAAIWLNDHREQLVVRAASAALEQHPQEVLSPSKIDDFQWGINKYLKRISHCLEWGRNNLLDEPTGLDVFPPEVYESAFLYVKERIPPRLQSEVIEQLSDCIDYLIERL